MTDGEPGGQVGSNGGQVRAPAVRDLESPHRLVRASAGTGKTYRLTVELLGRMVRGGDPETILATTFTRKAAGEILERLLLRLAGAAEDDGEAAILAGEVGEEQLRRVDFAALLGRVCRSLHRLQVGTLDAFFYRLLRSFRLELAVPARVVLAANDDPRVAGLRGDALEAVLDELGGLDFGLLVELLDRLHEGHARRAVSAELDHLLAELHELFRQIPDPAVWRRLAVPDSLRGDELGRAVERLDEVARTTTGRLGTALRRSLDDARSGHWQDLLARGPGRTLAAGKAAFGGRAIPPSVRGSLEPLVVHARAILLSAAAEQTEATYLLLHHFERHFEELRRRERLLLFGDLPFKLARQLPALDAERLLEVYYRLDARVAHLLVDEFQDTSLEQWQVLRPFVDEILAHGDASRTFFCVGDPKQAIYGWRGGCAELFGSVEELIGMERGGGEMQRTSYRSAQVVLDAVDRVFGALHANAVLEDHADTVTEWLESYVPLRAHEPARGGYVELVTSAAKGAGRGADEADDAAAEGDDGEEAGDGPSEHDRVVADLVQRLLQESAEAPGRTIGVLVQTNAAVRRCLELLRRRGVAASGEGGVPILDDPAVLVLLSALVLADHPADGVAAYHVARSPLAVTVGLDGWRPARAGGGRAAGRRAAEAAAAIRERLADVGAAELLAEWTRVLSAQVGESSRVRLAQLVELADRWEQSSTLRASDFVDVVASSAVEEPSAAAVRVMTVHKAKGLEFDITVLAQLDRRLLRTRDLLLWVDRSSPVDPPRAVHRAVRSAVRKTSHELEEAYRQEVRREVWDGLSGLYVAMTRARSALHLVVPPLETGKEGRARWGSPSWGTILMRALHAGSERELCEEGRTLFVAGRADWAELETEPGRGVAVAERGVPPAMAAKRRSQTGARRGRRLPSLAVVRPSSPASASGRLAVRDVLRLEGGDERRRGILLHAWLREIEWLGEGVPDEATLDRVARRVVPRAGSAWLAERRAELGRILAQPAIRQVFSRPAGGARGEELELWRERPFAQVHGGRLIHGVFDRVVVLRRRGEPLGAELLDLKSDRIASGAPPSPSELADLDVAVERYRSQLDTYRIALAAMLGILPTAVRARLVFLVPGLVREL